jgi:hypothetical protein
LGGLERLLVFEKFKKRIEDQWRKDSKMGRAHYILRTGVVSWGLPTFLLSTFVFPRFEDPERTMSLGSIVFSIITWGVAGYLFGAFLWRNNVKEYGISNDAPRAR